MKFFLSLLTLILLLSAPSAKAQSFPKIQKSASARAAYGNAIPFEKHARKNQKTRKKARKAAKKKKISTDRDRYKRGIPI